MQSAKLVKAFKEKTFSLIVLIAAIWLYIVAGSFQYDARPGSLGPDFWPRTLLMILIILSVLDVLVAIFKKESAEMEEPTEEASFEEEDSGTEIKKRYPVLFYIGIAMTVGYVLLVDILGFTITTFLYLAGFMYVGRYRKIPVIVISSLIGTLLLVLVFMRFVYVSLPLGTPPFDRVTELVFALLGIN